MWHRLNHFFRRQRHAKCSTTATDVFAGELGTIWGGKRCWVSRVRRATASVINGDVWVPGGLRRLQSGWDGRSPSGGFDSRPSPPISPWSRGVSKAPYAGVIRNSIRGRSVPFAVRYWHIRVVAESGRALILLLSLLNGTETGEAACERAACEGCWRTQTICSKMKMWR
jgi:hypothetical protein